MRTGRPGPRVLRDVLDQHLAEVGAGPRSASAGRAQRLARLGLGDKAMAAIDGREVELHDRLPGDDAVVVGRVEGLAHLARRRPLDRTVEADLRHGVRDHRHVPGPPARAVDGEPAILHDLERLRGVGGRGHLARPARHGFVHRQRPDLAVETDRDLAALRHLERLPRDVVEVEARAPGVGRGLHPALPDRSGGERLRPAARRHLGHAGDAPDRAEEQRHDEGEKRHVAQREGVAGRDAKIGADGPRGLRPLDHAQDVGAPDRLGCGIARPDGLRVGDGGERAARQGPVEPVGGLGPGRPAEGAHAAPRAPGDPAQHHDDTGPHGLHGQTVLQAQHQRRERGHHDGPERPEGARRRSATSPPASEEAGAAGVPRPRPG
jgi:hypothetical protein